MTREDGFTIIEVLVASLILVIAAMTTAGLLTSATKNTQRAQGTQVALDRAQQEIEKLRSLSNQELALTAIPAQSTTELNPGYRVNSAAGTYALARDPVGEYAPLVVKNGPLYGGGTVKNGVVNPGPSSFTSGDISGKIYRYIVWRNDERCAEASCPGTQDYKQIVVAVQIDSTSNIPAQRGYAEVQSNFVDPSDSAAGDPTPGAEGVVTAQQFFLSDTPCASSGETARQEITAEHLLHNTLGICANGLQNGTTKGAPDALLLGGPPDPAPEDPLNPLRYDYSNDFYLEPSPDTDRGLQIRVDDTPGCHFTPTGTANPQAQVHRWVTDPMQADFKLSGKVTLKFFTRTLNDATHPGGICIFLFKRKEEPTKTTDLPLKNKTGGAEYWTLVKGGTGGWPKGEWKEEGVEMNLASVPTTVLKNERLGLGITVDPSKTPGADAISIMYDFPAEASRLEVETTTPIDGT